MIPRNFLLEWAERTPWPEQDQVEQDLVLSRAITAIFADDFLAERLAFRGGTAPNKLLLPIAYRYSEDIDLVQVAPEPIGLVLDRLRLVLDSWLGRANSEIKENAAKLRYKFVSETGVARKLKIEINTREHGAHLGYDTRDFSVDTRWFKGQASVRTFQLEEILATKLRALLQRDKGRDLFDLKQAAELLPHLDHDQVIETFQKYLVVSRANAEHSVLVKLERGTALDDLRPLVPLTMATSVTTEGAMAAVAYVLTCLAAKLPGATGELTEQRIERLGLEPYMEDAVRFCARSSSTLRR